MLKLYSSNSTKLVFLQSQKVHIRVFYDGKVVGEYFADILVQDSIIIELKATKAINLDHEAQLLNYLKATKLEVGLLLNFGTKPEIRRKILENSL